MTLYYLEVPVGHREDEDGLDLDALAMPGVGQDHLAKNGGESKGKE